MTSTPKTSHLIHCHDAFFFFLAPKIDTCAKLFDQMMGVISMDEKKKVAWLSSSSVVVFKCLIWLISSGLFYSVCVSVWGLLLNNLVGTLWKSCSFFLPEILTGDWFYHHDLKKKTRICSPFCVADIWSSLCFCFLMVCCVSGCS